MIILKRAQIVLGRGSRPALMPTRSAPKKLLAALGAALLVTLAARETLLVKYHVRALRNAEQHIFAPKKSSASQQFVAFLFGGWRDGEAWATISTHHEDALLRLGYFTRWEFPITNEHINATQLGAFGFYFQPF